MQTEVLSWQTSDSPNRSFCIVATTNDDRREWKTDQMYIQLQQYSFSIGHRPGRLNGNADYLSSLSLPGPSSGEGEMLGQVPTMAALNT